MDKIRIKHLLAGAARVDRIDLVALFGKEHFQALQNGMFIVDDQDAVHGSPCVVPIHKWPICPISVLRSK